MVDNQVMQATTTYKCPKCNGSGYLACYSGIANGVCFSCEGNGFKIGVAPVAGIKFPITAVNKATGVRELVVHVTSKSAAAAVKKAAAMFARGTGYQPETAQVAA